MIIIWFVGSCLGLLLVMTLPQIDMDGEDLVVHSISLVTLVLALILCLAGW